MPISTGDTLGPYEILASIGAGGMGEVYRARDTRLKRDVAIKVLPAALANDTQYMARFEREAQILAALNHPNIAAVYGIEQGALVMELVEGANLRGPLPLQEAIPVARQITQGLEAAHERGIIHRDLKPANIKITPGGVVKILDFGLAKAADEFGGGASGSGPAESPTRSLSMTQAGTILGTAAYMSPEQARGKAVDKRADIWAFGVVLFELLTGRPLFGGGETASDALAAVIMKEPDWNALPADTPSRVVRLLEHCLAKDPKRRLCDIGDARLLLDEPDAQAPVAATSRRTWLPWTATALALLAAGGAWLRPKAAAPGLGVVRFQTPMPPGTTIPRSGNNSTQWMPSPDGSNLAMIAEEASTGKTALWIRPLGATSAHRLDGTEAAMFPFWSPDGQFVAFVADGQLKRAALSGGSVQTVCPVSGGLDGGAWGPDGAIVYAAGAGPLMRVNAMGGIPQPVTELAKDELTHAAPQILPGGRQVLYFAENRDAAKNAIYVQEPGSAKRVRVLNNLTRAMWSPPGYLLFVREGTLFAQRMDPRTFQVEGETLAVAHEVAANDANGRSSFAVSGNGVLAYRSGALLETTQLTWRDRSGKALGTVGQPGKILSPSLSPDGKSVAVMMGDAPMDVWVMDLTTGVPARMTHDATAPLYFRPIVWSPDSGRLAVTQAGGGIEEINLASGQILSLSKERISADDWSPDGRAIICVDLGQTRRFSLLPLAEGAKRQAIPDTPYRPDSRFSPEGETDARISPDGRYVVYFSHESGTGGIYVATFPSFAVKRKVSNMGGMYPVWARSGREIFYRSNDGSLMSVEIRPGANIEASVPNPLFKLAGGSGMVNRFAVSADGTRFLISDPVKDSYAEKPAITVVLNWVAELKAP